MFDELSGESNVPVMRLARHAFNEIAPEARCSPVCYRFLLQAFHLRVKAEEFGKRCVQSGGETVNRVRGSRGGRVAGAAVRFV